MGMKTMRIQYRTTFADVVGFIWINYTRSWVQLAITGGLSAFLAWDTCRVAGMHHGSAIWWVTFLTISILFFCGFSAIGWAAAILTALSRRNKTFMTDNTLELMADKFLAENRYAKVEYKWDIVQKIVKTRRFIVLYLTHSSGIVVPKRAFQTDAEWEAFYNFVVSHGEPQNANQAMHQQPGE